MHHLHTHRLHIKEKESIIVRILNIRAIRGRSGSSNQMVFQFIHLFTQQYLLTIYCIPGAGIDHVGNMKKDQK